MQKLRHIFNAIKSARVKSSGILLTRWFATVLLIPIVVAVLELTKSAWIGYVDDNTARIIDVAIKVIDHIYVPSVLASLVGYLALFIDRNDNGIPDPLEKESIYKNERS